MSMGYFSKKKENMYVPNVSQRTMSSPPYPICPLRRLQALGPRPCLSLG